MYVPDLYAAGDPAELVALMRAHAFATLVSVDPAGAPFASHVPLLLEDGPPLRLLGHVARANPQWRHLERDVLAIFHGPHAYVSPSWIEAQPAAQRVPTWNYAAVHATGRARVLDEGQTAALLVRLTEAHEAGREPRWRADLGEPTRRAMVRGVVGFVLEAPRLEGKLKLAQNRTLPDRRRIAEALAREPHPGGPDVARLMARHVLGPGPGEEPQG
jgi:transcriptional regulator